MKKIQATYPEKNIRYTLARVDATDFHYEEFEFDHAKGANFQDLIHLSGEGRKDYCEKLAAYVAR